ncbi:hypothetical protein BV22DRAFT_1040083, partial [Leucogyrophana mollusca]
MGKTGVHGANDDTGHSDTARRVLIFLRTLNIASPLIKGSCCEDETRVALVHTLPVDRSECALRR